MNRVNDQKVPLKEAGNSDLWQVEVALPVPIRKTFTYLLPQDLSPENLLEGRRVLVPFGPRIMFGVTWSNAVPFTDIEHRKKYRFLVNYEADLQILSNEIRNLIQWMENYYLAPLGELLKLALPPGVLEQREPVFELTAKGMDLLELDSGSDVLIHLRAGALNRKQWIALAGQNISMAHIKKWERGGVIRPVFPGRVAPSTPRIKVVELTDIGRDMELQELKRRPRQKEILEYLRAQGVALSLTSLKQVFPTAAGHLKSMEQAGIVCTSMREKHKFEDDERSSYGSRPELRPEQQAALEHIAGAVHAGESRAFLLFGVTGSGKTEVYLRAIEECLERGQQALLLVPEIALTPLMKSRITQRFGTRLAILHSAIPKGERTANWSRVLAGKVDVVLGARSGIFAPLPRLGLVIVDEEHDSSYKQGDGPRYHARDLALVRGKFSKAVVVLGSATPSLESWKNAQDGKFSLIKMALRATKASLPEVEVVDMKEEFKAQRKRPVFSRTLIAHMKKALDGGDQVMLLLNRRGFHNFLLCRKCGYTLECQNCEVTLTYHKQNRMMKCHYCDYSCGIPENCPECGAENTLLQFFGEGTQLIEEQVKKLFPETSIDRLDRDRLTRRDALESILDAFRDGSTQVLIGTQMIAKGHDFHNVTLVGILNADQGLRIPDFRAAERTFQLVTQVAGRSGRGNKAGRVVIQTYMPDHYSIQSAKNHDFLAFSKRELLFREGMFYPPFSFLFNLIFQSRNESTAREAGHLLMQLLNSAGKSEDLQFLGPVKAALGKVKNKYRYQILIKAQSRSTLNTIAKQAIHYLGCHPQLKDVEVFFDVDPYHFT